MRGKQTLVINGKVYDAVTGLPVAAPDPVTPSRQVPSAEVVTTIQPQAVRPADSPILRTPHHAKNIHRATKKSGTLRREFVAKPTPKTQPRIARRVPSMGNIERSEMIQRFAPHPQPLAQNIRPKATQPRLDITPIKSKTAAIIAQKHSLTAVAQAAPSSQATLSSRSVRERLIAERLANVDTTTSAKTPKKERGRLFSKQPRLASLMTASFAVIVLGGYFTYLNMPGLSVRVAAAQADVAANYPDYHPDGYSFSGPVAFASGQVAIDFRANGGSSKYTVTQQKSTWDSQAVYDNVVAKAADDSYVTNSQQGLTIYTFKGEAAWVNKGILYTISGNAPLSNEQLLRIAGSL